MRSIAAIALGGTVSAAALFWATSSITIHGNLGPGVGMKLVADAAFDPWTGEPHGAVYDVDSNLDGTPDRRVASEPPSDMIGRRAVPLPVGFALGTFIVLVWLTAGRIGARRRASNDEAASGSAPG